MSKIHSFAQIVLAAIGIIFCIRMFSHMLSTMGFLMMRPSVGSVSTFVTMVLALLVVCYLFFYKRSQLAEMIVGKDDFPDADSKMQWLPAAFRLVCILAGLYCLHSTAWSVIYELRIYYMTKASGLHTSGRLNPALILGWAVALAIGVYLLCGAPHFVRWHVKKTIEQCASQQENQ